MRRNIEVPAHAAEDGNSPLTVRHFLRGALLPNKRCIHLWHCISSPSIACKPKAAQISSCDDVFLVQPARVCSKGCHRLGPRCLWPHPRHAGCCLRDSFSRNARILEGKDIPLQLLHISLQVQGIRLHKKQGSHGASRRAHSSDTN